MSRCPSCMREIAGGNCPHCGYPVNYKPVSRFALPIGTLLNNRYEIGGSQAASYQSVAYVAADRQTGALVIVTEFFPKNLAGRGGLMVGVRKNEAQFAFAVRSYMTSGNSAPYQLIDAFSENNTSYRVYALPGGADQAMEEADILLDIPVYFRDEANRPVMSVNALMIPQLPAKRAFRRCAPLPNDDPRHLGEYQAPLSAGSAKPAVPMAAAPAPVAMPVPPSPVKAPATRPQQMEAPKVAAPASQPAPAKKSPVPLIIAAAAAVLVIGVGLFVAFGSGKKDNDDHAAAVPSAAATEIVATVAPTDVPTPAPTEAPMAAPTAEPEDQIILQPDETATDMIEDKPTIVPTEQPEAVGVEESGSKNGTGQNDA